MNTIVCRSCGVEIEIDKALEGQIEARVLAAERHKHETELEQVKKKAAELANEQLKNRLELEAEKAKQTLELEREKNEAGARRRSQKEGPGARAAHPEPA